MAEITLYHGSPVVVDKPDLTCCRERNDYGRAFYCTCDPDLAREWACSGPLSSGYVNRYSLDPEGLDWLNLQEGHDVLEWIAVLLANRTLDREWNEPTDAQRIIAHYALDLTPFDVVEGYRADDSYFSIARAFVSGAITDVQLEKALQLGGLGVQVALRSEKALARLTFVDAEPVSSKKWWPSRQKRDRKARADFQTIRCEESPQGKRIYEIGGAK